VYQQLVSVKQRVAGFVWDSARKTRNVFLDELDVLAGRNDGMTPPRNVRQFVGGGDFRTVGEEFLKHFVELGGLRPDARVLDVGAGAGRMAVPLTRFLSAEGGYDGLEIVPKGVRGAQRTITPRHPNFRFHHADVYNQLYNPRGRHPASSYHFPFPDGHFDFVFATSVFTHMLPADVANYVAEIARVLRPGGTSFVTAFLITPESRSLIAAGASTLDFRSAGEGYLTVNPQRPEDAVALEEEFVREVHERAGLGVLDPIYPGDWSGRPDCRSYQDIVLARHA
jgi:SAM-dependent methyltransferase